MSIQEKFEDLTELYWRFIQGKSCDEGALLHSTSVFLEALKGAFSAHIATAADVGRMVEILRRYMAQYGKVIHSPRPLQSSPGQEPAKFLPSVQRRALYKHLSGLFNDLTLLRQAEEVAANPGSSKAVKAGKRRLRVHRQKWIRS